MNSQEFMKPEFSLPLSQLDSGQSPFLSAYNIKSYFTKILLNIILSFTFPRPSYVFSLVVQLIFLKLSFNIINSKLIYPILIVFRSGVCLLTKVAVRYVETYITVLDRIRERNDE